MSLSGGICGLSRGVRGCCGASQLWRVASLLEHQRLCPSVPVVFQWRHRRLLSQQSLRVSTVPSTQQDGPSAASVPADGFRIEAQQQWPADITERARRLFSEGELGGASAQGAPESSASRAHSFMTSTEMQQHLQAEGAQAFWARVKKAVSRPLSGATAAQDESFGALEGAASGSAASPIVYKRYIDGMTAAHHYPCRLLPASLSAQVPPLFYVTPFDLEENPGEAVSAQALGLKGTDLFKSPKGMQQRTAVSRLSRLRCGIPAVGSPEP